MATSQPQGPDYFLRDVPVDLVGADAFAHTDYAVAVSRSLLDAKPPFTLGLFGPWGVGKSSVIEAVGKQVADTGGATFTVFDAWRHDGGELRRHFLRDVANDLKDRDLLENGYKPTKKLQDLDVDVQSTSFTFKPSGQKIAGALITALVIAALLFVAIDQSDRLSEPLFGKDAKPQPLIALFAALLVFVGNLLAQVFQPAPIVRTARRLEDPDRFTEKFIELVNAIKRKRLVIAIDNLDRCSPDRAVEVLSTIKTYLEPAEMKTPGKEVVFLIAVDDAALRRHLLSQELDRSEITAGDETAAAARYVDEFLRKFFSATLRIHPFLRDDLRDYIQWALRGITARRRLDQEKQTRLTELVESALRQNPRRVIQFVNNLEMQMRAIDEREKEGGERTALLSPKISDEITMVAKLAIIEEEWPRHFRGLVRQPHLLDEWHERIEATSTPVPIAPHGANVPAMATLLPEPSTWEIAAEEEGLIPFLRASGDIRTPNLLAFIYLKQSEAELATPEYLAFRSAALSGGREEINEIVKRQPEHAEAYAELLRKLYREQLDAGWPRGARSAVDVALMVESLRELSPSQDLVAQALSDSAFAPYLRELPLSDLMRRAVVLGDGARDAAVNAAFAGLTTQSPYTAQRASAEALGIVGGDALEPEEVDRLKSILSGGTFSDDHSLLRRLADANPAFLPDGTLDRMTTELQSGPPAAHAVILDDDRRRLLEISLEEETELARVDRLVQFLPQALVGVAASDGEKFEQLIAAVKDICALADRASREAWSQFVAQAGNNMPNYPAEHHAPTADWLLELVPKAPPEHEVELKRNLLQHVVAGSDEGVHWTDKHPELQQGPEVAQIFVQAAVAKRPDRQRAAEIALTMDPSERENRAAAIVEGRITSDDPEGATELFEGVSPPRLGEIVLAHVNGVPEPRRAPLVTALLKRGFQPDSVPQHDQVRDVATKSISADDVESVRNGFGLIGALHNMGSDRDGVQVLVREAITLTADLGGNEAASAEVLEALITGLVSMQEALVPDERFRLSRSLQDAYDNHPGIRLTIVEALAAVPPIDAENREELRTWLLGRSGELDDRSVASALVRAAGRIGS